MIGKIILFKLILLSHLSLFSQQNEVDLYNQLSCSVGIASIPNTSKFESIGSQTVNWYNGYGPSFNFDWIISNGEKNLFDAYIGYGHFNALKDTVEYSPINPDPNSYTKHYDLEGGVQLFSIGINWQRLFGVNSKFLPYFLSGGGILIKHVSTLTGFRTTSYSSTVDQFEFPPVNITSFNLKCGIGVKHALNDKFSLFEQLDASYMIIDKSGLGKINFSPKDYPLEFLLNFQIGILYNLD